MNVSVFGQTNLSYFDYVNIYLSNYNATDTSEGGLNKKMSREISFYGPRLEGVDGDFSIANKVLTDYSRAYGHSEFNTSQVANKNEDIPEGSCFLDEQPTYLTKHWEELGPFGDNISPRHGQIHNFAYSPYFNTDHTMYACSYYGGVWKSIDRGQNWTLLIEGRKLPFAGVGNIVVHPNNAQTLFISTGKNTQKSDVITSQHMGNDLFTSGIYRSTNGGQDWEEIMDANIWNSFKYGGNIKNMFIDPSNSNRMYLATSEGIWLSNNILNTAPTWSKISTFTGADDDFKGIAQDFSDPNYLYFSSTKLVRMHKTNFSYTVYNYPAYDATSHVITSNIATTPAPAASNYVYIYSIHTYSQTVNNVTNWYRIMRIDLFDKTTGAFVTKDTRSSGEIGADRIAIAVSPTLSNWVIYGQQNLYHNLNFLTPNSSFTTTGSGVHADIHAISFAPGGYGVYLGTDGGISYKGDNGAWITMHKGINNTLIQDFDDSEVSNKVILTGLQDNQTFSKTDNTNWIKFGSGDGYNAFIDDEHYKNAYFTSNSAFIGRNLVTNTSNSIEQSKLLNPLTPTALGPVPTAPMQNHPKTGKMIFTMREGIYQKNKKVATSSDTPTDVWSEIVSTATLGVNPADNQILYKSVIAESNPDYIYAIRVQARPYGSNSASGPYFFRKKPNTAWESIGENYATSTNQPVSGWHANRYPISSIAVSSTNPEHIWITISGYNNGLKVYKSTDAGNTFTNADPANCLPDLPVNDIVYQDGTDDRIYIATDVGVYTTQGTEGEWYRYGDIPNIRVDKLKINRCSGTLKASTFGRGLFETDLMADNNKISNAQNINTNETWTEDKALTRNVSIQTNKILTIDGATIYMPKNGRITVHKGAKLVLKNGAKITNGCDEMWDGIIVLGTSNSPQPNETEIVAGTLHGQGVLLMDNATLEHAKEAIRLNLPQDDWQWPFYLQFNGGVVRAQNSFFINNRRSAEFMTYNIPGSSSSSVFENCQFLTNNDYRLPAYAPYHISIWDNHGVHIIKNKFEDQRASISIESDSKATGIYTIDADFIARGFCNGSPQTDGTCVGVVEPNKFINLKRGIHATATGSLSGSLQIYNNEFENCFRAVTLRGTDNAVLVKNKFNGTINGMGTIGAYIENMTGYIFTQNKFNSLQHGSYLGLAGFQGNRVFQNDYSNTNNLGAIIALPLVSNNAKVIIDCNTFKGQLFDFYLNGSGCLLDNQGTNTKPRANTFLNSHNGTHNGYLLSDVTSFDYFAYSNPATGAQTVPDYGTPFKVHIIDANNPINPNACPAIPLNGVLVSKNGEMGGISVDGYHSILNSLDYYNQEDATQIDNILAILITHHLAKRELDKVIQLLQVYTDDWHKVQLASFYTLDAKYDQSKYVLNHLITNSTNTEIVELAEIYAIKNELARNGKTWFEMNELDKNKIMSFARRDDFKTASLKAKNILMLINNMFFEENFVKVEENWYGDSTTIKPIMKQYPNPIAGILNLEYSKAINEDYKVEIYNLLDNTNVYSGIMSSSLFSLDVSAWTSGFYSIVVTDNTGVLIYKSSTKIKN